VGPEWTDHRRGRHVPASDGSVEETDFLITSGMLVPVEAYRAVGRFDEGLFIDSTDREWCFRAVHRGHRLLRISGALLSHELGDSLFSVMALPGLEFARHRPERLYYMMRNRTLLYGRRYVPASWKIKDAMRATGKFVLFSFFVSPRFSSAQFMLKGIIDGLRGKTGPRQR
jgi:rhamnosyltransferase